MIEKIWNIVQLLLGIAPFVFLCFVSVKTNIPKVERSKQYMMPVIALVYVIVAMLLMNFIDKWLLLLLDRLPKWIAMLAGFSWMPKIIGNVFLLISNAIRDFLNLLNLNFWICYITNTVIIIVYLTVKKICIKVMQKKVKTDGAWHTRVAGLLYDYYSEKDSWCIKENYVQARSIFKVFYYSALTLSALLMIVTSRLYLLDMFKAVFYPVFGIIIVGELYFFLDGVTAREYSQDILGEDEDAYHSVNYSLLRKFLRSVFGDKLMAENTSINNAFSYDITTNDIIRELEKNEDPKIVSFASYISALNATGVQIDHNYLNSSLDMLNGKSILFNNPFYNDLVPYAFYPMNRALLSHQKVLVVLGRHSVEDDIKEWLEKGIESVTNIPFLWNIGILGSEPQDLDIGIVTRSDVLDIKLHDANSEFLEKVGFFVVIEPSRLLSTAQIGLNMLVKKCRAGEEDKNIVYCLCDKNCDGLVDAMSHALMTSITEVSATHKHLGTSSYMCWEENDEYLHHRMVPNISRYLGMGTELSFAALKNQVSKAKWYGGEAFPVTDIRWISKQYYYDLTKYAGLSTSQEAMDEAFDTTANFWSAMVSRYNYMTVEDESYNMFEILRDFSTRTTEQGFINIISSEYLLKDYMTDNASVFETDPKAIPYIVADYTRSNRNTILRLILMMSTYPVSVEFLEKELSLLGIRVFDLKKQLWYELYNCYSEISEICQLPDDYTQAVEEAYSKPIKLGMAEWNHDILCCKESFSLKLGRMETTYTISDSVFLASCVSELRSAGYVAEDEKGERYYLGAELSGHIYQKYLPGQFFTFGGKYYEMQYLTADGQVLVRRAADHITGRPSYRQLRDYTVKGIKPSDKIGAARNISGMKVVKEFADICVETPGYYLMEKYNDFTTAREVSFEGESKNNRIPVREYRNKEVLRIELPDLDGKLTDNIRYTVTLLLNELFRTIFAENQAFISAVTDISFLGEDPIKKPLTYSLKCEGCTLPPKAIYIIEDSQLDLGLTVAVERNLHRLLSIVQDYLDWHTTVLEESLIPPPDPEPPVIFADTDPGDGGAPKKKGFFARLGEKIKKTFEKIKGWFKKKPKKGADPEGETDGTDPENGEEKPETPKERKRREKREKKEERKRRKEEEKEERRRRKEEKKAKKKTKDGDTDPNPEEFEIPADDSNIPSEETDTEGDTPVDETYGEGDSDASDEAEGGAESESAQLVEAPSNDEFELSGRKESEPTYELATERKPYHERYFMLYGSDSEPTGVDATGTLAYLAEMGIRRNELKQARESKKIAEFIEANYQPGKPDVRYCDFCGAEIYGVEYETLADGRDRCISCSRTAIKTGEEFRKIFNDVKRNMESFFGIKLNVGVRVEMVNSKELHKRLGKSFVPTKKADGRVLGVAIKDKNGFSLYVENGSPRLASMLTMAHELTHIWQYVNWNEKALRKLYGRKMMLEIYEGMAKWVEIQYAYLINEPAVAKREEIITYYRDDEYGRGFLRYRACYPFSQGTVITKPTPFMYPERPLDPQYCGPLTVQPPRIGINPGDIEEDPKKPTPTPRIPAKPVKGPKERDPEAFNRYAFSLLDTDAQSVYDAILNAINSFNTEVGPFSTPVTTSQIKVILDYVQRDHPETFWFQHGATYYFDKSTDIVDRLELKYCMTPDEVKKRKAKIDAATSQFMASVTDDMSDYEVTLRIYENIIKLVDYDTIGLERQKKTKTSPEVPDDLRSIYGVFVNRKAVCAGYSKALQYLLNMCGIECVYVTSDTHAWNLIRLEGDYYHIDVTWGDGSNTEKSKENIDAINYDCFCITDGDIARLDSHVPESILPLPACTATECNYHVRHGLCFDKFDFDRIRDIVCESIKQGKFDVSFKFASDEVFNEAKRQLVDVGKFREIIQYANLKTDVKLSSTYMSSSREEKLIIAFYITKM